LAFGRFDHSLLVAPGRIGKFLIVREEGPKNIFFEGDSKTTNPVVVKKG
jgi:hypothetical protein